MSESKNKKNISFRVSEERQEELKIESARRHISIQQMLEVGLHLLLAGGPGSVDMTKKLPATAQEKWHMLLTNILTSGDKEAIRNVQQALLISGRLVGSATAGGDSKAKKA